MQAYTTGIQSSVRVPPGTREFPLLSKFLTCSVVLALLGVIPGAHLSAGPDNSPAEVFPLKPGLHYSYEFSDSSTSSDDFTYGSSTRRGRIQYLIVDSAAVDDTTATWVVLEVRNYTEHWRVSHVIGPGLDSTFIVDDTVSLQLIENTNGKHELKCSGIVWKFPLNHLQNSFREPIYRFADSPDVKLTWSWLNPPGAWAYGGGRDTVEMSTVAGYSRRSFSEWWLSGYLSGSNSSQVRALSLPASDLPDTVVLDSPANLSILYTDLIILRWFKVPEDVDQYSYQVASDSLFAFKNIDSSVTDTSCMVLLSANGTYWWRVQAHNAAGWGPFSEVWRFSISLCDVSGEGAVPRECMLMQNHPNPFNPSTIITYTLPKSSEVRLTVVDIIGREVSVLVNERKDAGVHETKFDGTGLSSGIYFYRLQAGSFVQTRKMLIVR